MTLGEFLIQKVGFIVTFEIDGFPEGSHWEDVGFFLRVSCLTLEELLQIEVVVWNMIVPGHELSENQD